MTRSRLAIAVTITAALLSCCTSKPQATPTESSTPSPSASVSPSSSPSPSPSSVPAVTVVVDSSWISTETGWVLAGGNCGGPTCGALIRTNDGGSHWQSLTAPPATVVLNGAGCSNGACVSHIRFATARVGYAYGNTLFMTTDGGATWQKQSGPTNVNALEISQGHVYRVGYSADGCPGPCGSLVDESNVGSTAWHTILTPDAMREAQLVVQGSHVYVASFGNPAGGAGDAHTELYRSADAGATWKTFPDPCGSDAKGEVDTTRFAAAPPADFVVLCQPRSSGAEAPFLLVSSDAGTSFGTRHPLPLNASASALSLAAGSSSSFLVSYSSGSLAHAMSSHDAISWKTTLSLTIVAGTQVGSSFLGFEDASTARAAFGSAFIWTMRDAGATWTKQSPLEKFVVS